MTTWAIGDIHGCWLTLQQLLEDIEWCPEEDRLWLVGDLVNRGPGSLEVLRWAFRHRQRLDVVLGNHDLHLLARVAGCAAAKRTERLGRVLDAPDIEEILAWLGSRPLVHRSEGWLMVHAGLLPTWSEDRAIELADEISSVLAGPQGPQLFSAAASYQDEVRTDVSGELESLGAAMAVMTRVRMVNREGHPRLDFTGPPSAAPEGLRPWFELSGVPGPGTRIVFGHWANLGLSRDRWSVCLDSGCVYGGALSAVRLGDGCIRSVKCRVG